MRALESIGTLRNISPLNDPRGDNAPYAIIIGYLGLRKAKTIEEAKAFGNNWLTQVDVEAWSTEIMRFLSSQLSAEQPLNLAVDKDMLTEAHAYIGEMELISANRPGATLHFQWVRDNGNRDFPEYKLALGELKRLEAGIK